MFRVVVAGGTERNCSPGRRWRAAIRSTDTGIRFEPQFPLVPGRDYVAILKVDSNAKPLRVTLALPKPPPGPRVAITAVYPSANRLPENTLRFYVHFSGEVARGDIYRHFKLVRDDGVEVKEPFLELDEELWSTDGNRLTVLFHPGRVKRELVPREEDGADPGGRPSLHALHQRTSGRTPKAGRSWLASTRRSPPARPTKCPLTRPCGR